MERLRLHKANRLHPLKTSLRWRYFFDDAPSEVINDIWPDTALQRLTKIVRRRNFNGGGSTMSPHDHRPGRPCARSYLRFRYDCLCCRAMGPPLDHDRYLPRGVWRSPARASWVRALSPTTCWPIQPDGSASKEAEVTRTEPSEASTRITTSDTASCTSACPTSRSNPSPTTPKST